MLNKATRTRIRELWGNTKEKIKSWYRNEKELQALRIQRDVLTEEIQRLASDNADLWELLDDVKASEQMLESMASGEVEAELDES